LLSAEATKKTLFSAAFSAIIPKAVLVKSPSTSSIQSAEKSSDIAPAAILGAF